MIDIRAIAERHEHDKIHSPVTGPSQMHDDRGALLDVLRKVATWHAGGGCAVLCEAMRNYRHAPDCPATSLEALRS